MSETVILSMIGGLVTILTASLAVVVPVILRRMDIAAAAITSVATTATSVETRVIDVARSTDGRLDILLARVRDLETEIIRLNADPQAGTTPTTPTTRSPVTIAPDGSVAVNHKEAS